MYSSLNSNVNELWHLKTWSEVSPLKNINEISASINGMNDLCWSYE